jgi:hypothetical protein
LRSTAALCRASNTATYVPLTEFFIFNGGSNESTVIAVAQSAIATARIVSSGRGGRSDMAGDGWLDPPRFHGTGLARDPNIMAFGFEKRSEGM